MPDKYEREIEDILRNLKRRGVEANPEGERRGPVIRRSAPAPRFSFSETCLIIAIIAALFAGGWAEANGGGNLLTGLIALIGAVCLVLVALSAFIGRQRPPSSTRR